MKRNWVYGFTATLITAVIALIPYGVCANESGIEINENSIPDADFRRCVSEYDLNADGELSNEEIAVVKEINVRGYDIVDLTGIEFFTSLESLDCSSNSISNIDVSKNVELTKLNCRMPDCVLHAVIWC